MIAGLTDLSSRLRLAGCWQMVYTVDCVKTNTAEALEILADAVLNPRFQPWDVADQVEKLAEDLKAIKQKPQTIILEVTSPTC